MDIVTASRDTITKAATLIRRGEVVAFPTETVYGLGADATNAAAVARVFAIKERPSFDPLIVHVNSHQWLSHLVKSVPAPAAELTHRFWPGPLTVVLPKTPLIPDIVTAGLPSVAVRVPDHPVALDLIAKAGRPIAAPSANRFGHASPTLPQHVVAQLGNSVPMVLDGGPCRIGVESTIIAFVDVDKPVLLRPGGLPIEEVERVIGSVRRAGAAEGASAPGRSPRHYATQTPLTVINHPAEVSLHDRRRAALLLVQPLADTDSCGSSQNVRATQGFAHVEVLAPAGQIERAAAALFACMHQLDTGSFDHLYAVAVPETGLGRAIMDRLRRAQAPKTE